ncbi:recombinase family protein [Polaribacter vadi]|uniref:recombinase family protein n=1 Tax=Polaribacter TaxID=52959 RepID=UPI001C0A5801|nr:MULTISPECIES: recombinase family protein [Polaribacter]MBU3010180.1 recombinase family protein [Polaribacter vadi]MDO6739987.1 recombinase family protein [Polaribacter sp. 1_MG-2023]
MEKLHIYARVSTKQQVEKDLSIDEQIIIGKKIAEKHNLRFIVHKELGKSASYEDLTNRPIYSSILELIKSGKIKYLYAFDITRLSRNQISQAYLSNILQEKRVTLFTSNGKYNFQNTQDQFIFDLMKVVAQHDNATRVNRFKMGNISANRKGIYTKPNIPYGYKKNEDNTLSLNKEEVKVMHQIVDWYLKNNWGTNKIANILNKQKVLTRKSKTIIFKNKITKDSEIELVHLDNLWNPGTINEMFKNSILYGVRKFKVGVDEKGNNLYNEVQSPKIISKTVFNQIASKRKQNAISKKRTPKYFRLLAGLLICGKCGNNMEGRIKVSRGEYIYRCTSKRHTHTNCGSRGINLFKLNKLIWNEFENSEFLKREIDNYINTNLTKENHSMKLKQNLKKLKQVELKLEKLNQKYLKILDLYAGSEISKEVLDLKIKEIEEDINEQNKVSEELIKNQNALTSDTFYKIKSFSLISKGISMFSEGLDKIKSLSDSVNSLELNNKKTILARKIITNSIQKIVIKNGKNFGEFKIEIFFKIEDNPTLLNNFSNHLYNISPKKVIVFNTKEEISNDVFFNSFFK